MEINMEVLTDRLNKIFQDDTQEKIGEKLHMTQGNVSKILSGSQQPTLETILNIAEAYGVSVDWILGRTEKKEITNIESYATAIQVIINLIDRGAVRIEDGENGQKKIIIKDLLIKHFVKKAGTLFKMDKELYKTWISKIIALFEDKKVIGYKGWWSSENLDYVIRQSDKDENWIDIYKEAKANEDYQKYMDECRAMDFYSDEYYEYR